MERDKKVIVSPVFGEIVGDPEECRPLMICVWNFQIAKNELLEQLCRKAAGGDDVLAEDLMVDVVAPSLPAIMSRWDGERNFENFAMRSLYYLLKRHLKKIRRMVQMPENFDCIKNYDRSDVSSVYYLVESLEPLDRVILILNKVSKKTYRQIALTVGKSYGFVAASIARSLEKLRKDQ